MSTNGTPTTCQQHQEAAATPTTSPKTLKLPKDNKPPAGLFTTDYVILGLLLGYLVPWFTLFVCITLSVYRRIRHNPRFKPTMVILNELIAENAGPALADFIAPVQYTTYKWRSTPQGTVLAEEP